MYELRLWLSKRGRIRFVSHLDMFRLLTRAVRRAGIPLWYTEGFNPHPYISFLLALSLGVEGEREPVDLRIVGDMKPEEVRNRLNGALPEGLCVEEAASPVMKPSAICFAEYEVVLDPAEITAEQLTSALSSGKLTTEKTGKSKGRKVTKTVNVSEQIRKWELTEREGKPVLNVILPAGSVSNLNPMQLFDAVNDYLSLSVMPERMLRRRLLTEDLREFQ